MTIQELFEIKIYHGYILQLFLAEALFFPLLARREKFVLRLNCGWGNGLHHKNNIRQEKLSGLKLYNVSFLRAGRPVSPVAPQCTKKHILPRAMRLTLPVNKFTFCPAACYNIAVGNSSDKAARGTKSLFKEAQN